MASAFLSAKMFLKGKILSQDSQDQILSTKEDFFSLEGQRAGNKKQRLEIENEGEGQGKKEEEEKVFVSEGNWAEDCLWLERTTDVVHRKMAAYKGKMRNPPC